MNNEKLLKIIWIMNIYIFFSDIFTIIATVWVSTKIKILFFFYFCFSCIHFFCISYIVINFVLHKVNCLLHKIISKVPLLLLLSKKFFIFEILLLYINSLKFNDYFINCPYLFKDINDKSSLERICELYNIGSNSRYKYQYVCSYDSSKDFIMKLKATIRPNSIICVRISIITMINDILTNFNEENIYYTYYCHRTNQPSVYSFDKTNKYCKRKVNMFLYISIFLIYIRIIYFFIIIKILKKMAINQNIREINNLLRFLSINLNNNNMNTSNSTKVTENEQQNGNNEEFVRNNTRNVVIENNQEFSINYDIGDKGENNKEVNPPDIRLSFPNRRENGINTHNDRSNVNIINNN